MLRVLLVTIAFFFVGTWITLSSFFGLLALPSAYAATVYACMALPMFFQPRWWHAAVAGAGSAAAALFTGFIIVSLQGGWSPVFFLLFLFSVFLLMPLSLLLGLAARYLCIKISVVSMEANEQLPPKWTPILFIVLSPLVFNFAGYTGVENSVPSGGFAIVQALLVATLTLCWVSIDAKSKEYRIGKVFSAVIFLLAPVSVMLYFFRFQRPRAACLSALWVLGLAGIYICFGWLGEFLAVKYMNFLDSLS